MPRPNRVYLEESIRRKDTEIAGLEIELKALKDSIHKTAKYHMSRRKAEF